MSTDRQIHAESDRLLLVRYDRAGKWYIEPKFEGKREQVSLSIAVWAAMNMVRAGGVIYADVPGGKIFEARIKKETA